MSDPLRETAQTRLATLRQDLANGRAQLAHLRDILPKIEGAVQVLEELLAVSSVQDGPIVTLQEDLCPNPNADAPTSSRCP
jgi:hypothetical protein